MLKDREVMDNIGNTFLAIIETFLIVPKMEMAEKSFKIQKCLQTLKMKKL